MEMENGRYPLLAESSVGWNQPTEGSASNGYLPFPIRKHKHGQLGQRTSTGLQTQGD